MNHLTIPAKKSLRLLGLFIITLCAATALSSCEPDDDDLYYYDSPIGDWQQVAPTVDGYVSYSFYGDRTGVYYVSDYYGDDDYDFVWWTNGIAMTIDFGGGEMYYYTWQIQGDNLYLTPDDGSVPIVLRYIY